MAHTGHTHNTKYTFFYSQIQIDIAALAAKRRNPHFSNGINNGASMFGSAKLIRLSQSSF